MRAAPILVLSGAQTINRSQPSPAPRGASLLAVARLKLPLQSVIVRANVVYCCAPPAVRHGLSDGPGPLSEVTQAPGAVPEAAGGTETTLNQPTDDD